MKYLTMPCPRCEAVTLQYPKKSGARLYSFCERCKRKSLFIIHDKANGEQSYSIIPVGAKGRGMVRATFWIEGWHKAELTRRAPLKNMQSQIVRLALDRELC